MFVAHHWCQAGRCHGTETHLQKRPHGATLDVFHRKPAKKDIQLAAIRKPGDGHHFDAS